MGYRSEVRFTTTERNWKKISKHMKEWADVHVAEKRFHDHVSACLEPDLFERGRGLVYVGWNYRKWNEWCEEVVEFMKAVRNSEEPYRFMRLGEDYDDVEFEDNDPDYRLPTLDFLREPDDDWALEELNKEVK